MSGVFYNMLKNKILFHCGTSVRSTVVWSSLVRSSAIKDPCKRSCGWIAVCLLARCVRLVQVTPVSPLQYLIATNICVYGYLPHPMPLVLPCQVDRRAHSAFSSLTMLPSKNFFEFVFSFVTVVIYIENPYQLVILCSFSFLLGITTGFKSSVGIVVSI